MADGNRHGARFVTGGDSMTAFLVGVVIGGIVGAFVGTLLMALAATAKRVDAEGWYE